MKIMKSKPKSPVIAERCPLVERLEEKVETLINVPTHLLPVPIQQTQQPLEQPSDSTPFLPNLLRAEEKYNITKPPMDFGTFACIYYGMRKATAERWYANRDRDDL